MAFSFSGIQLFEEGGRKLRLVQQTDGSVSVAIFVPGQTKGEMIGSDCGTIGIETQNSRINNIRNVKGSAVLSCAGGGHQIAGSIVFENCH